MLDVREGRDRESILPGMGAAGSATAGAGAALGAAVASACCAGPIAAPFVVAVLGAGGAAWAASLKPYSPIILASSGLLVAYGFWSLYRSRATTCRARKEEGSSELARRILEIVVWSAGLMWLLSLGLNLFLPGS